MVDMDHPWQTDFVGHLPGDVEWNEPENCDACKPTRTLTPTIVSRLASMTSTASTGAISLRSPHSPNMIRLEKP
jgi:hypothetical protein